MAASPNAYWSGPRGHPSRLYPLRPHAVQAALDVCTKRFIVVPAGRRSGKTEKAKRRLVRAALSGESRFGSPRYFAAAPTRDQAQRIYWSDLKAMIPRELMNGRPSESHLQITLRTGVEIQVIGLDRPERMEGSPWDGGVVDEIGNAKSSAFPENIRPALSDRRGWCWLIGVPEGRNHYYDLWKYAISGVDPDWAGFTWKSSEILDASEIESARRFLDARVFEQEYNASFVDFEGRAYYAFTESAHCAPLAYDPDRAIAFCFDFNVDPGVCAVVQEQRLPGQYERDRQGIPILSRPVFGTGVIGEVWIPQNSTTRAVCNKLIEDWGLHCGAVHIYGDATGGARGSAKVAGSDWEIVRDVLRPAFRDRLSMRVPAANPPERKRLNAMNTRLEAGDGTIRMMVDPAKAPHVVKDLEGVRTLKGGSGEIDKKADPALTHITDGLGYYVAKEFPVIVNTPTMQPLRV